MKGDIGSIQRSFLSKIVILALGVSVALAAIFALFWRAVPDGFLSTYFALAGFLWVVLIGWIIVFWRYQKSELVRPLVTLARDIEAEKIIGKPINSEDYAHSFIAPIARLLKRDETSDFGDDGNERRYFSEILQILDQAVMVVANDHRLLLANDRARELFAHFGGLTLGGDISQIFDRDPIDGAILRQELTSTRHGERIFLSSPRVKNLTPALLTVVHGERGEPLGYAITAHDSASTLVNLHRLERAYDELMITTRRFAQVAIMNAAASGDERLLLDGLEHAATLHVFRQRGEDLTGNTWLKSRISLRVFAELLHDHINQIRPTGAVPKGVQLRCDPVALIAVLEQLVNETLKAGDGFELRFEVDEASVKFILKANAPVPIEIVEHSQAQVLSKLASAPTAEEVMRAHSTEIWPHAEDDGTALVFIIERAAARDDARLAGAQYFDFNLPSNHDNIEDAPLDEIGMVVFDTETTGLDPAGGDDVVSISAVRVLNGQVIASERFDRLVNPGRNIPATSTAIHGITNAMVADADSFDKVLSDFHDFANGAPLVAHNAAFDMAFIRKAELRAKLRFDQPILDTVYMSAFIYDHLDDHTLDGLAERLDVVIPEAVRHTAMGDAIATAEIVVRLIPLLADRGVERLDQMIEIGNGMRRIQRAQRQYGGV